ncbi:MAG: hypothetical protein ACI9A2_003144 [Halioglobus sp.]
MISIISWTVCAKPGWIDVRLDEGKCTVARNDKFPERVGREILQDLDADDGEDGIWRCRVYAEKLGEYKDAKINLPKPGLMKTNVKVGFMSRTIEWTRVEENPCVTN